MRFEEVKHFVSAADLHEAISKFSKDKVEAPQFNINVNLYNSLADVFTRYEFACTNPMFNAKDDAAASYEVISARHSIFNELISSPYKKFYPESLAAARIDIKNRDTVKNMYSMLGNADKYRAEQLIEKTANKFVALNVAEWAKYICGINDAMLKALYSDIVSAVYLYKNEAKKDT